MGLDMYFYASADPSFKEESTIHTVKYFRKHSDLHGFLEDMWYRKGNTSEFNCEMMPLTMEDLEEIEKFAAQKDHPKRTGFFWGSSQEEDWEETRDLIPRLKNLLKSGLSVAYYPLW